jgi:UDP-GlcNAc:undecaprenyl-phosphate GlcNAc-1-phosphate transferase
MGYLLAFFTAFLASLALTPLVRGLAYRAGVLDQPDAKRKLHPRPIPKLGGVAILAAFALAVGVLWASGAPEARPALHLARLCAVPALFVLALGIADDLRPVSPAVKITVQVIAALWVFSQPDLRIEHLSNPFGQGSIELGVLSAPLTVFWIVLITNAFNIVDGMDGLAAGVAFISTCCVFLVSLQMENPAVAALSTALAGALLAFLRYNFNPASIFLGDSGSLTIGLLLAIFSIAGGQKSATAISIATPLFILALPIVETITSTARRFLRGQSVLKADSAHIHHQLLRRGLSPRRVAILLYLGSAVFGAASLFMVQANAGLTGITALVLGVAAWAGIQQLGYSEFIEIGNAFKRGFLYQRRIIQNSIITRRLADELRSARSLDDAWSLLVEVAERLEFHSLELVTDGDVRRWTRSGPVVGCHVLSVHLQNDDREVGRVVIGRSRDAEALHSELALLVETISDCLPPLAAPTRAAPADTKSIA